MADDPGCGESDMTLYLIQNSLPETPWSSGPVGGINTDGCGYGRYGLFEWGVVSFYQADIR